jgi:hypothetical protein
MRAGNSGFPAKLYRGLKMKRKLDDFQEWQMANAKYNSMLEELTAIDIEKNKILSNRGATEAVDTLELAAQSLLAGKDVIAPPVENDDILYQLRYRTKVLNRAIPFQKRLLQELQTKLSREICSAAKPEYSKMVRKVADIAKQLHAAVQTEEKYRTELENGSVLIETGGLEACCMTRSIQFQIEAFLNRTTEQGHI